MEISAIAYCPPMEQDEEQDYSMEWEKETLQYVVNNKGSIMRVIRGAAKKMTNLNTMDFEDIYSEVLEYLYKSCDYDMDKAVDPNSGNVITLEGYVKNCVKNCVKRYITATYRREKAMVRDKIIDEEGRERDILDTIEDTESTNKFNDVGYDVESYINAIRHERYKYGKDIFLILYLRLLIPINGDNKKYIKVLEVMGINKKELSDMEKQISKDINILNAIKAISLSNREQAMAALEKQVYGAKKLRETINLIN